MSPSTLLGKVAAWVLRHRRWVIAAWLAIFALGTFAAGQTSKRLTFDFSLPGQPGYETAQKVLRTYGNGGVMSPSILVVSVPRGQDVTQDANAIGSAFAAVERAVPQDRLVDLANTADERFVTSNGTATFAYLFSPPPRNFSAEGDVKTAQAVLERELPGYSVGVTGIAQLEAGNSSKGPGVLAETMIGGVGALAVLLFVFASALAILPLLIASVSILATFALVLAMTYLTDVSFVVEFLISLVGLGVAIDYSLLLVTRWREERHRGAPNDVAVIRAVETAGRSVVLSGLTVAIGLVALAVLPVPALRSVGIGGMLIPLVSILVVDTLLPAILGGVGPRVDWPRLRHEDRASRSWSAWATGVARHRWLATVIATGALALSIIPVFGLKVGQTSASAEAKTGPAHSAYQVLLTGGVPSGVLTPIEVLTNASAGQAVAKRLDSATGIDTAALPAGPAGTRSGLSDVIAIPAVETVNNASLAPVRAAQSALRNEPGVIGVTGDGPIEQDYVNAVFGHFPLMFSLIALVTFLLLARAFRSVVLAAKAVVLNLASLAATFGLLTWFWQEGHGSRAVFGIPATGAITFWLPLMVVAFLFGLSMDYEVFILSRVREEHDAGASTTQAVTIGLGRTGRLVTSAALILFLAFASLASAPVTDIKVLATALGAGILLDATVIRAMLVPALVSLFGRWNWWLPGWLAWVLRTKPSEAIDAGGHDGLAHGRADTGAKPERAGRERSLVDAAS